MTIFTVAPDVNNYLTLQESDLKLAIQATTGSHISLEGTPVLPDWQVLAVNWLFIPGEDDGLKKPDIATLGAQVWPLEPESCRLPFTRPPRLL